MGENHGIDIMGKESWERNRGKRNHGRGIMGEESWKEESWEESWERNHGKRNHGKGIMGEESWEEESWEEESWERYHWRGIMTEESWERNLGRRNHGGGIMGEESWEFGASGRPRGGIWKHLKASGRHLGGHWGPRGSMRKNAKTIAFYSQRGCHRAFRVDGSDPTLTISAACAQK